MSNPKKPVRGKSERARARNGASLSDQPVKDTKPIDGGRKLPKQKTVTAEIGATVMREETASLPTSPAQPPSAKPAAKPVAAKPVAAKPVAAKPVAARPAQPAAKPEPKPVAARPAQPAAKPEPKPAPKPAASVARPAPAASEEAPAASKPPAAETPKAPTLESAADTIERSFRAAGEGTVAVNCKLLDFARANVNSGFDHVKDLAAARSPLRVMRLQMEYWHDCLETFASQAQELRALSVELVANANEPIRQQLRRRVKSTAA
jgi:hypothetical protein